MPSRKGEARKEWQLSTSEPGGINLVQHSENPAFYYQVMATPIKPDAQPEEARYQRD